jgi:hypothetical protein
MKLPLDTRKSSEPVTIDALLVRGRLEDPEPIVTSPDISEDTAARYRSPRNHHLP